MQSLAEAYTCPSKGIGSPTPRYRTPRDRAKEKETTSRLSPWRVLSQVDARSLARCSLCSLARTSTFVRSLVLWLGSIDDRSADRSRAYTPRISPSRYAIKERQRRGYRRNWTRRDKTGRGRERNGTGRNGRERNEKEDPIDVHHATERLIYRFRGCQSGFGNSVISRADRSDGRHSRRVARYPSASPCASPTTSDSARTEQG